MRTDASVPPLSSDDCCRSIRTNMVGWPEVNLSLPMSATFLAKTVSCTKPVALAGMTDVPIIPFKTFLRLSLINGSICH